MGGPLNYFDPMVRIMQLERRGYSVNQHSQFDRGIVLVSRSGLLPIPITHEMLTCGLVDTERIVALIEERYRD